MIRPIHPFPARMAPDIAIAELSKVPRGSVVLDPMAGSGTVLRHASALGHRALGFDMDPLAVLMSTVANTPLAAGAVENELLKLKRVVSRPGGRRVELPWIDGDVETAGFIRYWFGLRQRRVLRLIAHGLATLEKRNRHQEEKIALNVLKVALSRIIITKDRGASLARDVSHSRPHKVATKSDYEVWPAFERAVRVVRDLLSSTPPSGSVSVSLGDVRTLGKVSNDSVDIVLTSPPYLNAIDYLRGHRLALVWLGHRLSDLRAIRSNTIGAERGPDSVETAHLFDAIKRAMCENPPATARHSAMIARYAEDLYRMMSEIQRVLKPGGQAVLVIGNSCLKGFFVRNSGGIECAGKLVGLSLTRQIERNLPMNKRYLPMPETGKNPLGTRMRTETLLYFTKPNVATLDKG